MKVEVRPLPVKKWHGKQGKESFTQSKTIEVLFNSQTGKYNTGLTEEEAEKYGNILGVKLDDTFLYDKPHSYWGSKAGQIELPNSTKIFNTDLAGDFVKIKNMKASKFVANSMEEWQNDLWPEATHVIFDEDSEMFVKASKIEKVDKANEIKIGMSLEEKISIIQIITGQSLRKSKPQTVSVKLTEIIENNLDEFLRFSQMDKKEVNMRATILEGIYRNILNKEGEAIYYMSELLGIDMEGAIAWFDNPQNSKMKVAILEKLNK